VSSVVAMWPQRGVVVLAAVGHEAVVFGSQGGIETAGLIGADEQGLAQKVIATLGGTAVASRDARGVQGRDKPAERPHRGQGRQRPKTTQGHG
jgi:hypothetical protein